MLIKYTDDAFGIESLRSPTLLVARARSLEPSIIRRGDITDALEGGMLISLNGRRRHALA